MSEKARLTMPTSEDTTGSAPPSDAPRVTVRAEECFNYAAWQNSVPLIRSLTVTNPTAEDLASVTIQLATSPAFATPQTWTIDRVEAGQQVELRDTDIAIDADYLERLDEAVRGTMSFRLCKDDQVLAETMHPVRVLARDEWGGMHSMGELLPAFVTPNDPAIAPLLKAAAEALDRHGHPTALDGYQSGDPNRAYMLAAALWSAVAARSLTYASPPSSFEQVGQKTRRVGTVLGDGLATCLDTTLLFASGLEAMGLNPVLVMQDGHCFAGVWLVEKTLQRRSEPDGSEVRKAIAASELIVFETTLVTHRPAAEFGEAVAGGRAALDPSREDLFVAAIDVARARMAQILPLASHAERKAGEPHEATQLPPLPAAPNYAQPLLEPDEPAPQTPAGRIERWQRKLLDLSMRNRLLNFRLTKQTIPVLCPDVSLLEDRLALGKRMRLVSLEEHSVVGERDANLHRQRTQKDVNLEFAREALQRNEVACQLEAGDLDVRCTAIYRRTKNDLAEGGANTLFLAVGFLHWKQNPADAKTYRAPLILVPVTLLRSSVRAPYRLAHHEDDVRFNATLVQLLKKDFDCDLSTLESELPSDDSGVDVPQVLAKVRQAVRDISGFEVFEDAAVASFSFAKHLMWKDLTERVGQLTQNRVVRHLVTNPDEAFSSAVDGPMPTPRQIDTRYTPAEIVHPLPADSSQLSAVMAASEGHDLVIVGPPGTGKSQTIANVIAQCLAVGKTVLFVAEKTAALDVVHRRLREHGLGDCCVELHSNKAERRRLLQQLRNSWERRARRGGSDWLEVSERLRIRRDELNAYVAALHREHANGWTVYRAMGLSVRERDIEAPTLNWSAGTLHDRDVVQRISRAVDELALTRAALPAHANVGRVAVADWSMGWERDFLATCDTLSKAADAFAGSVSRLSTSLGVALPSQLNAEQMHSLCSFAGAVASKAPLRQELVGHASLESLEALLRQRAELITRGDRGNQALAEALAGFVEALGGDTTEPLADAERGAHYRLANELVKPNLPQGALVFHATFAQVPSLSAERRELLDRCKAARQAVEAAGLQPLLIERINVGKFDAAWSKAEGSFWPLSAIRRAILTRTLKSYARPEYEIAPAVVMPVLREYRDAHVALANNADALALPADLETTLDREPASLPSLLENARRIRDAILAAGLPLEQVARTTGGGLEVLAAAAKRIYPPARELKKLKVALDENLVSLALPPDLAADVAEHPAALDSMTAAASRVRAAVDVLALSYDAVARCVAGLGESQRQAADELNRSHAAFRAAFSRYAELAEIEVVAGDTADVLGDAIRQAQRVISERPHLKKWTAWMAACKQARELGLDAFVDQLDQGKLPPSDAAARFQLSYVRWWLPTAVDRCDTLRQFQRFRHEETVHDFRRLDDVAREAAAPRALSAIYHDLPPSDQVPRRSELGLLRHQMGLKRPSKSIREVISRMPETFGKLAPCVLMSPLSIAQYLPAQQAPFDVVVFDEASQIATWDAIGAIARGKQTIIVGDPKQLPPTNFFGRAEADDEDDELAHYETDLESILDEAQASGLPTLQLNWHYRSRHESLITFSNHNYYGNQLITFPAAESAERGVSLTHVEQGTYDRGKSRTNRAEAAAIVADAVSRMRRCLAKPEAERLTYGVVTFNSQQQSLIQDLFDQALRETPALEWFFADDRIEPTAVKNLENVQGDERDVMYFSITFGKDAAGKFPIDFGALNREGGHRRLNVAVTRARQALLVYASFLPDELRSERSSARGVHDLKAFLSYAHKGPAALASRTDGAVGATESPFEEAVKEALQDRGWLIDPQVGVSGFRVDLGVVDPDRPGAYLAGVECDGATYHRSAAARDRDKIRQQVLENLGWNIVRVWSPDWWYDARSAIEQLHATLKELLEQSRQQRAQAAVAAEGEEPLPPSPPPDGRDADTDNVNAEDEAADNEPWDHAEDASDSSAATEDSQERLPRPTYRSAELAEATAEQGRFFDDDYSRQLRDMALAVVEQEGPIRDDVLARRIARAHGFARTGSRIKERVLAVIPDLTVTTEEAGRFVWPTKQPVARVAFRYPADDDERRSLDEIALEELVGLASARQDLAAGDDPALALAREIGLSRLSQSARDRLEAALEMAQSDA